MTYQLADPAQSTTSSAPWTAILAICNLNYQMTVTPTPADANLFQFDQPTMTISVFANQIIVNGTFISGQYTVEIRVKSDDPAETGDA